MKLSLDGADYSEREIKVNDFLEYLLKNIPKVDFLISFYSIVKDANNIRCLDIDVYSRMLSIMQRVTAKIEPREYPETVEHYKYMIFGLYQSTPEHKESFIIFLIRLIEATPEFISYFRNIIMDAFNASTLYNYKKHAGLFSLLVQYLFNDGIIPCPLTPNAMKEPFIYHLLTSTKLIQWSMIKQIDIVNIIINTQFYNGTTVINPNAKFKYLSPYIILKLYIDLEKSTSSDNDIMTIFSGSLRLYKEDGCSRRILDLIEAQAFLRKKLTPQNYASLSTVLKQNCNIIKPTQLYFTNDFFTCIAKHHEIIFEMRILFYFGFEIYDIQSLIWLAPIFSLQSLARRHIIMRHKHVVRFLRDTCPTPIEKFRNPHEIFVSKGYTFISDFRVLYAMCCTFPGFSEVC